MRVVNFAVACLLLASASAGAFAQAPAPSPAAADASNAQLEQKIETISNALAVTQQQIEQSQRQIQQLQQQLLELRQQMAASGTAPSPSPAAQPGITSESPSSATPATT